jgi:hypothetical protein
MYLSCSPCGQRQYQHDHTRIGPSASRHAQKHLVAAAVACPMQASAQIWKTYHNPRFGTMADVPADWKSNLPPTNEDGLTFRAPDGKASLAVYGNWNLGTVAEAMADYEAPQDNRTVTYRHREARAITLSGTKGDLIFYEKHLLSCQNQVWNSIYLEYPAARKKDFDAFVTRVAQSLRPSTPYGVECNE